MMKPPGLSVIVAFYNMSREVPRTLFSLSPGYQKKVDHSDYEVLVVDCGSVVPLKEDMVKSFGPNFRLLRFPPAPSPARAINRAVEQSRGNLVTICIDGARILSPGILSHTLAAYRAYHQPVVATLGFHLGPKIQNESLTEGYNQEKEDALLNSVDWKADGYELFNISVLAASSRNGWFLPISESNCLTLSRDDFATLGGLNERFTSPGGGLVNLDFYKEACGLPRDLVVLLGEGSFHQFHGGVATNVPPGRHPVKSFLAEYLDIRGVDYSPPVKVPVFMGSVPAQATRFLAHSITSLNE
jgi:glycosyltransferase involved in cell wall biosynthesis